MVRRGRRAERLVELERIAVSEHRPEDRHGEQEEQEREPEHELLVAEGEVERLAPPAHGGGAGRSDDSAGMRDDGLGLRVGRHYDPWIPVRVRGSTIT